MKAEYFQINPFNNRRRYSAMRMAPMIDVVFLLLIFFLVAAKWRPQEDFLPFRLPAARAGESVSVKPEPLMFYISAIEDGCEVRIGQTCTVGIRNQTIDADLALLMEKIRDCMLAQKRIAGDPVEILCNKDVKWEYFAKIYNLFYGVGLTDITFAMTE